MIYNVATKGCVLSEQTLNYINRHAKKLVKLLPNYTPDLPLLDIVIKKQKIHLDHYKEQTPVNHTEIIEKINPKKDSPVYYEGTIKITLPIKTLVVKMQGKIIDETINDGFKQINKELKKYKGKHFRGNSEYSDKKSIKDIGEEGEKAQ